MKDPKLLCGEREREREKKALSTLRLRINFARINKDEIKVRVLSYIKSMRTKNPKPLFNSLTSFGDQTKQNSSFITLSEREDYEKLTNLTCALNLLRYHPFIMD